MLRQTTHKYCEKKAVDRHTERKKTRKLTIAVISECSLCFYPVGSRKK
jgi:hypothetical protein